jgi:hypothetical protein
MSETTLKKFELDFDERIFSSVMLSPTEWIIRTHNKIIDFKDSSVSKIIEINDFGDIIDTFWGGNYALSFKHNHILLIGRDRLFAWDRNNYSFKVSETSNKLNKHTDFPNSDLRPYRASTDNSDVISVLLQTQVSGESPFWADIEVKSDLTNRWLTDQPKHLNARDYPLKFWQTINKSNETPDISDLVLMNKNLSIFTTGFHKAYGKYDMDYSIMTSLDENASSIGKQLGFESAFGSFSSDKNWLILKPLHSKGETKGKTFLVNIETNKKTILKLPRGLSKYRILDIFNETLLLSNDSYGKYPNYNLADNEKLTLIEIKNNWS